MELQNLYAALAQPTQRLYVTWPAADLNGSPLRPSFVLGRIRALLPGAAEDIQETDCRLTAPIPALELAGGERNGPLWQYFSEDRRWRDALRAMERAARMSRGRLTPQAVETLYGRSYRMSASRIDKINSCHFAYFMQYGLRARERTPARFDAAQVGTFLHYVLEHVTKAAAERGGFARLEPGELEKILDQVVDQYMAAAMPGFEKRENRFKYLFRRLRKTVGVIVENVAEELMESDFVPLEFELGFGDGGKAPAITIRAAGAELTVVGKVDRVDGWLKNGRLYLRVVDYKSGKKSFDLRDVCRAGGKGALRQGHRAGGGAVSARPRRVGEPAQGRGRQDAAAGAGPGAAAQRHGVGGAGRTAGHGAQRPGKAPVPAAVPEPERQHLQRRGHGGGAGKAGAVCGPPAGPDRRGAARRQY